MTLRIPTQVLAVDPGISTALVLVQGQLVLEHETIEWGGLEDFSFSLRSTLARWLPLMQGRNVVIEKGPPVTRNHGEILEQIDAELRRVLPEATWVTPQYWKRTPQAAIAFPGLDRHCKDAARMGVRYLWLRRFDRA